MGKNDHIQERSNFSVQSHTNYREFQIYAIPELTSNLRENHTIPIEYYFGFKRTPCLGVKKNFGNRL